MKVPIQIEAAADPSCILKVAMVVVPGIFFKQNIKESLPRISYGTVSTKTEAMHFPPPRLGFSAADTSRIDVCDSNGDPVGFIDFTKEFKYLGSIVHNSLSSEADVDKEIKSATAAFGALKNVLTNRHLDLKL